MIKKIFSTTEGFKLTEIDNPKIGLNDVLIEVHSSFFSPGTEKASAKKIQESILKKSIRFKSQIIELIKSGEINTLIQKAKKQNSAKIESGYSVFGKVILVGDNVKNIIPGQYVVAVGEKASHGNVAVCPQGLVFACDYNLEYSSAALVSIALNSVLIGDFTPFSKILVLGGGLLGQFILQILKSMSFEVGIVEINNDLREISMKNGAKYFLNLDDNEFHESSFDGIISTLPYSTEDTWLKSINFLNTSSSIVLVGAGDLNVPRELFYKKRLNFITAYSYGAGRGEYDYEINANHDNIKFKSGFPIHSLIQKSLFLIENKIVNLDFIDEFEINNQNDLEGAFSKSLMGILFKWPVNEEVEKVINNFQAHINTEKNDVELIDTIDVIGNSAFFNDSHKDALSKNNISINKITTRSPKSKNFNDSKSESLIISTPHLEHWQDIKSNISNYSYIFVDKPIITNKKEFNEYINLISENKIICLMNRRYSEYTFQIKKFINSNPSDNKLFLKFNVPKKNDDDSIYFSGGRIIGEMCHHIDLALFLNGDIKSYEVVFHDNSKEFERIENCDLYLKHKNGSESNITYTTSPSPFYKKEAIWSTINDKFICLKDFQELSLNNLKIKINEKDKGCKNLWSNCKKTKNLDNMINLDLKTYNIINEIIFK